MKSVLVLVGPSAVGKTTVMTHILEADPRFILVRSATTRAPRGDGHNSEYIYLSREEFLSRVERGEMLEHMEYGDNLYGTPRSEIERIFGLSKIPLLILDIEGVKSLKSVERDFKTVAIYVWQDLSILCDRLFDRELKKQFTPEAEATYKKRVAMNKRDYASLPSICHLFDSFVKNDTISNTVYDILSDFEAIGQKGIDKSTENEKIANALSAFSEKEN